jgi:hypothetical protein
MGFWGKPYKKIREVGNQKFIETWIDHFPGPSFEGNDEREEKIKQGLLPDLKLIIDVKEVNDDS